MQRWIFLPLQVLLFLFILLFPQEASAATCSIGTAQRSGNDLVLDVSNTPRGSYTVNLTLNGAEVRGLIIQWMNNDVYSVTIPSASYGEYVLDFSGAARDGRPVQCGKNFAFYAKQPACPSGCTRGGGRYALAADRGNYCYIKTGSLGGIDQFDSNSRCPRNQCGTDAQGRFFTYTDNWCYSFSSIAGSDWAFRKSCAEDAQGNPHGISTAIGCIPTDNLQEFLKFVLKFAFFASGGIILLMTIATGYTIITSAGNPEKLQAAKENIVALFSGLFLIAFSLILLQTIGADILKLPTFTP